MPRQRRLLQHDRTLLATVELADTFWGRARGLLGRRGLPPGQGLWLAPCAAIHTLGMRFPLDLIFLDRALRVVRVVRGVRARRFVRGGPGAHSVLEVASGWLPADAPRPGAQLTWAD